jgi:riboflavin synthase
MFTGIVTAVGTVSAVTPTAGGRRLTVTTGPMAVDGVVLGDSIAVDGVCLTVAALEDGKVSFDVSGETLGCTTLGERGPGDAVNLEAAMLPTTRIGGHLVSGHVDGVGKITARRRDGESERYQVELPAGLARYVARKGSLCVNGVSLTVNGISGGAADLTIIPHTLRETNFSRLKTGDRVNVEVDIIARYLERLLHGDDDGPRS